MSSSFVEYPVEVYSTLEYNGSKLGQSSRHWSAETPQHADQLGIQVAIAEGPQTVQDDTPKLVRVASSPTSHILANESAIPGDPLESEEEPPSLSEHASFLGRSRRFWMIFGGIIIVIAAVIGGTVGGVLGSRHSSLTSNDATYSPAPSATSSPAVTNFNKYIHVDSNITATNFTDKAGYTYRAIFFQDTTSALIGCIWNSQNKTWNTLNITQITTGLRLDPGSPLTTTAKSIGSGQIFIWGFLQGNTIYQYSWYGDGGATDPAEDSWSGDSVNTATVKPYAGSHLASSWYRPVDFTGNDTEFLMMMYQANSGEMMLFFRNSTQIMVPATLGTSLAMGLQFNTEFGPACIFTFESSPSILLQPYYFLPSMGMSMGCESDFFMYPDHIGFFSFPSSSIQCYSRVRGYLTDLIKCLTLKIRSSWAISRSPLMVFILLMAH